MKNISILGSTGSIGTQTLDIIRENKDKFNIIGLSCNKNIDLLKKQIKKFRPKEVSVMDKEMYKRIKEENFDIDIYTGVNGLVNIATNQNNDLLITSVVGSIGLRPTYEAIKKGIDIGLANKETLVVAGDLITNACKKYNVKLLPIDSEHNAIFQSLIGNKQKDIEKIILTASGGSFLNTPIEKLKDVSPKEALDHPNWDMGKKITIDSATMMNKGLEVIEAKWLFNLDLEDIKVLVHPESIIHSMVEYKDKSVIAQLGLPDMKVPISFVLNYPERLENDLESLDLAKISTLNFLNPDFEKFPALKLAYKALKIGGTMPLVLNVANEIYVDKFLNKEIKFLEIVENVKKVMDKHNVIKNPTLEEILRIEKKLRNKL
ncbi:MAG: 1-deoxy-D-xylulose-5-phosphate reductoisomerase [Bacillota bacterium]